MSKYPQHLINVKVQRKLDPEQEPAIRDAVSEVEETLGNDGRVVLRASGTEPVIRVMVEGRDDALVARSAEKLASAVRAAAGS